jgi:hypothetical protein
VLHQPGCRQVEEDAGALRAEPSACIQPPDQAKHLPGGMDIPVAIAPLNVLGMCMAGDPAITIARSTQRVCHAQLAAHRRHHARRDICGISQTGAQKAYRPELEGQSDTDRVLAASHHQRTIGIIQINDTRSWVRGGLSRVAAIPLRVIVREPRHWHLDSLIKKGGGNRTAYTLAHQGVLRVYKTGHKGVPF